MDVSRGAAPGRSEGVVLLHGILRTSASLRVMERALAASGYDTLNLDYDSRHKPLEALVEDIHPPIASFCAQRDGAVHFVTHSMGGLLARLYLDRRRPRRLGRVVMLGPPHGGSPLADLLQRSPAFPLLYGPAGRQLTTERAIALNSCCDPIDYELGIVAGTRSLHVVRSKFLFREPNDGKVGVRSTHLDGMADHIMVPATHSFMMRNRAVVNATLAFLQAGCFRLGS